MTIQLTNVSYRAIFSYTVHRMDYNFSVLLSLVFKVEPSISWYTLLRINLFLSFLKILFS